MGKMLVKYHSLVAN